MPAPEKVEVLNVNVPGHVTRVDAERYHAMKEVLLKVLPAERPGLTQTQMGQAVLPHLPQHLWPGGEKSMWWVKCVQLDLEARGVMVRDLDQKPLRWRRI